MANPHLNELNRTMRRLGYCGGGRALKKIIPAVYEIGANACDLDTENRRNLAWALLSVLTTDPRELARDLADEAAISLRLDEQSITERAAQLSKGAT